LIKLLASSGKPASLCVLKKICGQLWYLSEELVPLAFFDPDVDVVQKRAMLKALSHNGTHDPPKRIQMDQSIIREKQLHEFVTQNSRNFFKIISIPDTFLTVDSDTWSTNAHYMEADAVVRELQVVNDTFERGVALMQEYNALLTKDEEQMQFILQVVKENRKLFPD